MEEAREKVRERALHPVHEHRDYTGAKVGMWLFLFTEMLLFGGMFLLYAVYRTNFPTEFHFMAKELDVTLGCVNTLVLLTSSMTAAMSLTAVQRGSRRAAVWLLLFTIACAGAFLVIKYFEWTAKFHHGLYPGSEVMKTQHVEGERIFLILYFMMTGMHGLHVVVGGIILAVVAGQVAKRPFEVVRFGSHQLQHLRGGHVLAAGSVNGAKWEGHPIDESVDEVEVRTTYDPESKRGKADRRYATLAENGALYWHIVDAIWIFLFPLFYLIT